MNQGHSKWPLPWQQHPITLFLAVLVGVGPLYAMVIYSQLARAVEPMVLEGRGWNVLANSMVMVVTFGLLALLVLFLFNGEKLCHLQLRSGKFLTDLPHAIGLFVLLTVSQWAYTSIVVLGFNYEPPAVLLDMARQLSSDPVLLAIFLGPMIWIQAALFEEFTRVFALSRLFKVWTSHHARILTVLAMAIVFGLGHLYQGFYGVGGTALIATLLGLHYLRYGRVLPLILAHGLYDTMAVLLPLILYKRGLL